MRWNQLPIPEIAVVTMVTLALLYGPQIIARLSGGPDANDRLMLACVARDRAGFERALAEKASVTWHDTDGETALMVAANLGTVEQVQKLVQLGADVNATDNNGQTPLMYAAMGGQMDSLKFLLLQGADPHHRNCFGHSAWNMLPPEAAKKLSEQDRERLAYAGGSNTAMECLSN